MNRTFFYPFLLLLAAAIVIMSCKNSKVQEGNSTDTKDIAQEKSRTFLDSVIAVKDIAVKVGDVISDIPVRIVKRTSSYEYTRGQELLIFRGPDRKLGGEFYPDPIDETKVGTIHVVNRYYRSADGVHVGMKYSDVMKIAGIEVSGSVEENRIDLSTNKVTYRIDFPSFQLKNNGNITDDLQVTRMIYTTSSEKSN